MKVMPASSARWMIAIDAPWSGLPKAPNIIAPRHSGVTETPVGPRPAKRADAERNRDKILTAARLAFAEPGAEISMAEISRRAGVGMATLYRNFPGRRELLEALYTEEVAAVADAATPAEAAQ